MRIEKDTQNDYFEYAYNFEFEFKTRKLILKSALINNYKHESKDLVEYDVHDPLKRWLIHVYICETAEDRLPANIIKAKNMVLDSLEKNFGVKMTESMGSCGKNLEKSKEMEVE